MGIRAAWRAFLRGPEEPAFAVKATTRLVSDALGLGTLASKKGNYTSYLKAITIPNVFKACSPIAYNFASVPLDVYDQDDQQLDLRTQLPALHRLLAVPNPHMDGFTLREHMAYDLLLTGNAFLAMDTFNGFGEPGELWRLRPDQVRIVAQQDGTLWYGYDIRGRPTVWYSQDEMLHAKCANPLDPYWGLGVIEAGESTFNADKLMGEFRANYWDRGAILEGLLKTDQELTPEQSEAIRTQWRAQKDGRRNEIRIAVLGQGTDYKPIQEPLGNIPIVALSKMSRNEVFELFGVPPAKVGDFEGTNYRNAQEADAFFWSETMAPLLKRSEPAWTTLAQCFGASRASHAGKEIAADYGTRAEAAQRLASTGSFKRNEIRMAAGYPALPADDPLGEQLITTSKDFQVIQDAGGIPLADEPQTTAALTGQDEAPNLLPAHVA